MFNYTIVTRSQGCVARSLTLWTVWVTIVCCFILPILMTLIDILTLKNIRTLPTIRCLHNRRHDQNRQFVQMCRHCINGRRSTQYHIEKQLTLMIIAEIIVTVHDDFKVASDTVKAILSPDSTYACAGGNDGTVFIWNTTTGKRRENKF
ncbi:unnamed protein product, partial [Rotaria sp. Silwood1]